MQQMKQRVPGWDFAQTTRDVMNEARRHGLVVPVMKSTTEERRTIRRQPSGEWVALIPICSTLDRVRRDAIDAIRHLNRDNPELGEFEWAFRDDR